MKKINLETLKEIVLEYWKEKDLNKQKNLLKKNRQLLHDFSQRKITLEDDVFSSPKWMKSFIRLFGVDENEQITDDGEKATIIFNELLDASKVPVAEELNRIRSMHSDKNREIFSFLTVKILHDMGKISNDDFNKIMNSSNTTEVLKFAQIADKLSTKEQGIFDFNFATGVVEDPTALKLAPPFVLNKIHATLKGRTENEYKAMFQKVCNRMDELSADMKNQLAYYYADKTNIADVYQGYMDMMGLRISDHPNPPLTDKQFIQIKENRTYLESLMGEYDSVWNLEGIENLDQDKIDSNFKESNNLLDAPENVIEILTSETIQLIERYKFYDENDNEVPQFLDQNGNPQLEYKDGYTIDPKGKLATVLELSKLDEVLKSLEPQLKVLMQILSLKSLTKMCCLSSSQFTILKNY
ncbi:MAG: hypothetical protein JXR30_03505 [Alphaproteobacteria bacterium]|nr:hypothetical protein [Alphaproteobacteria bacterium]